MFPVHGKRRETIGGGVFLKHLLREIPAAAIPEGVGFPLQLESLHAESVDSSCTQCCPEDEEKSGHILSEGGVLIALPPFSHDISQSLRRVDLV